MVRLIDFGSSLDPMSLDDQIKFVFQGCFKLSCSRRRVFEDDIHLFCTALAVDWIVCEMCVNDESKLFLL